MLWGGGTVEEEEKSRIDALEFRKDIIMGGTDATSTALELVMTEMMQHPEIMKRVQAELEQVVGINNTVEESHLSELHYLNAVVKETFRLHPAAPLLLPHSPSSSCEIGGYIIPKGVTVLCNAWSIHRGPQVWSDPLKFHPERFLTDEDVIKFDFTGNNLSYLPFGSGRRICPGIPLAKTMLLYVLGSLVHSFDWRLPKDTKVDFKGTLGVALKKATPLVVIPTPDQLIPSFTCKAALPVGDNSIVANNKVEFEWACKPKHRAQQLESFHTIFNRREGNGVADKMAKIARTSGTCSFNSGTAPDYVYA
ncbi:geraniol 8-hydroxylase-like [Papaver somniferum]|uniref:geraniol 8-hydroxylase-like n=1 Tax=Papaver somniferum TaxID=3469 RepID=UPI000E6FED26|nr:geraniol 8-hydroxylase-like [Papaver somniferum]